MLGGGIIGDQLGDWLPHLLHLFCQGDVIMHILYITNESGQHTLSIFKFPDPKLTVWSDQEIQM